jgi:hypothetical protein
VVTIDAYPAALYGNAVGQAPEYRQKQEAILAVIDQKNGDITFEEVAPGLIKGEAAMMRLAAAIHNAKKLVPGLILDKQFEVTQVSGNRVTIDKLANEQE